MVIMIGTRTRRSEGTAARAGSAGARHGGRATLAAFVVLFAFVCFTANESAHLMSNGCYDETGQVPCAADAPNWLRPLPGIFTLLGLCAGFTALLVARLRAPAMITGFTLTAVALITSLLLS